MNDTPRAGTLPAVGSLDGDSVAGLDLGRFFSDVEGETLTFGIAGLPTGLTFDSATGSVHGTIDRSASRGGANGDNTVTVTADDGHGGTTRRSFTWRVVDPAPIARNDGALTDARMSALAPCSPITATGPTAIRTAIPSPWQPSTARRPASDRR